MLDRELDAALLGVRDVGLSDPPPNVDPSCRAALQREIERDLRRGRTRDRRRPGQFRVGVVATAVLTVLAVGSYAVPPLRAAVRDVSGTLSGWLEAGSDDRGNTAHDRPVVSAAQAEFVSRFAVLREPAAASDRLPDQLIRMVGSGVVVDGVRQSAFGLNEALARKIASSPAGGAVFVLPGNRAMCLSTIRSEGAGLSCGDAEQVLREGIIQTSAATVVGDDDGRRLQGVVPDGVSTVRITRQGLEPVDTKVDRNGFSVDVAGVPTGADYLDASGKLIQTMPLDSP